MVCGLLHLHVQAGGGNAAAAVSCHSGPALPKARMPWRPVQQQRVGRHLKLAHPYLQQEGRLFAPPARNQANIFNTELRTFSVRRY